MSATKPRKKGTGNVRRFSNGVWQASFFNKGGRLFIEAASREDAESKLAVAIVFSKTDEFDGTIESVHQNLIQNGFSSGAKRAIPPAISSHNINKNGKTSWRVTFTVQGRSYRVGAVSEEEAKAKYVAIEKATIAGEFTNSDDSAAAILKAAGFPAGRLHSIPERRESRVNHGPFEQGVRLRQEGYYEGRYWYGKKNGSVYAPTRKEAVKKLRAVQVSIDDGSFIGKNSETLSGYLMWWLDFASRTTLRPSTQSVYRGYIVNHFIPFFGNRRLQTINTEIIQKFFDYKKMDGRADGKEGGVAHKTLTEMKNMLTHALNYAVNPKKIISNNPTFSVVMKFRQPKQIPTLESEQMDSLIKKAMQSDLPIAWAVVILLRTGMRRGELLGLKLSKILQENTYIKIDQSLCRMYHPNKVQAVDNEYQRVDTWAAKSCKTGLYLGPPKTSSSLREFPVGWQVTECINRLIRYQESMLDYPIKKNEDRFLVMSPLLRPYDPATFNDHFKRFLEEVGSAEISVHSTRHSFTTDMLRRFPAELPTISELVGHSSKSTTLRYSHGAQSKKKTLMDTF